MFELVSCYFKMATFGKKDLFNVVWKKRKLAIVKISKGINNFMAKSESLKKFCLRFRLTLKMSNLETLKIRFSYDFNGILIFSQRFLNFH